MPRVNLRVESWKKVSSSLVRAASRITHFAIMRHLIAIARANNKWQNEHLRSEQIFLRTGK